MNDNKQMSTREESAVIPTVKMELTVQEIGGRRNKILEVMKSLMKEGIHYGKIPGCPKPSLYKSGAEMLVNTFRLVSEPIVTDLCTPTENKYRIIRKFFDCMGNPVGSGIGEASTNEEKYKWRRALSKEEFEYFDPTMRREKFKKAKDWYNTGKTIKEMQVRTEPCDLANTVLKIGDKRALVGGVLLILGASEFFTCDVEDMPREYIDTTGEIIHQPETNHSPQRKSAQELTPEEIERKAAEAKARLHEGQPEQKSEPARAQGQSDGVKGLVANGKVIAHYPPKGKGPHSFKVSEFDDYLKTWDEMIAETMMEHKVAEDTIEVGYEVVTKGEYSNNMITGITAKSE